MSVRWIFLAQSCSSWRLYHTGVDEHNYIVNEDYSLYQMMVMQDGIQYTAFLLDHVDDNFIAQVLEPIFVQPICYGYSEKFSQN